MSVYYTYTLDVGILYIYISRRQIIHIH